jgi:hypothetical protein
MSQSPASAEIMGIGNMLNTKGGSSASQAAQGPPSDQHLPQQHPQIPVDRANSPQGSEHSRYSGPMSNLSNGASYPSPTAMGAPLPMPNAAMGPSGMVLPGLPANAAHAVPGGGYRPPEMPAPPPKAYPCSTCGKGFARRSDLARHGSLLQSSTNIH